jgi:hypothetical protein
LQQQQDYHGRQSSCSSRIITKGVTIAAAVGLSRQAEQLQQQSSCSSRAVTAEKSRYNLTKNFNVNNQPEN